MKLNAVLENLLINDRKQSCTGANSLWAEIPPAALLKALARVAASLRQPDSRHTFKQTST